MKDELFAQWGQAPIPGLPQTRGMSGRRVGPLSSFLSLGMRCLAEARSFAEPRLLTLGTGMPGECSLGSSVERRSPKVLPGYQDNE